MGLLGESKEQSTPEIPLAYVRIADRSRGPFSVEQLVALLGSGTISPDSPASEKEEGPWAPLATLPIGSILFPKRSALVLKADAARPNASLEANLKPVDHREVIAMANAPKDLSQAPPLPSKKNDVETLMDRLTHQMKSTEPPFVPKKPNRRRLWDFVITAAVSNVGICALYIGLAGHSPIMLAFLPLLLGPLNAGLLWVFFVVMGRY